MNKTIKALALLASVVLMGVSAPVMAQTAAATPAAPVVKVDGLVDAYYSYNFAANSSKPTGSMTNVGYFYNGISNSYSLGLAEAKLTATQGGATGVLQLAYNDASSALPIGPANSVDVLQAYASYNTGAWTFTGGRFVTWMGNEVVESTGNWNYSHSILFQYTIPVLHQGISVNYAFDSTFGITGYATNGWNNTINTSLYTAQTFGAELAWTPNSTWKFVLNGIDGPGTSTTLPAGLFTPSQFDYAVGELIVDYNVASDVSLALDAEYGGQDAGTTFTATPGGSSSSATYSSATFWGVDLYGKWQMASDFTGALRLEMVSDPFNVLQVYGNTNGTTDSVTSHEATLTFTKSFTPAWTVSLEGRYDWESDAYKTGDGSVGYTFAQGKPNQSTATLSTAFLF